ncbi:hypothetical protein [Streptomyces sp. NPDC055990]|uniref:hypothetical protein n=1 Tax=Streptomyces sp. NPDC055990 TaxID=3345672 RepID=UPI0035DB277C
MNLLDIFARLFVLGGLVFLAVMAVAIWQYERHTPAAAPQVVEPLELERAA